jgi:hypothetical protein
MKSFLYILIGVGLIGLVLLNPVLPVAASVSQQAVYFTPTPRPDGRIIYIVKANDTCISISLLNNIPEDTLRNLNNIKGTSCVIVVGQELLLGMAGPALTPTAGPSQTPTPLLPTSTPFAGNGSVCVILFNDVNGNGLAEDTEVDMAGGEVSLSDNAGKFSRTGTTVTINDPTVDLPLCFNDVPEGEYNVSIAVPQGYNPTTETSRSLSVKAGSTSTVDFGAQVSLRATDPSTPVAAPRSPLLGILGGALILAGAGLAFWLRRSSKSA